MILIKALLIVGFVLPILGISAAFVWSCHQLMEEERRKP